MPYFSCPYNPIMRMDKDPIPKNERLVTRISRQTLFHDIVGSLFFKLISNNNK